MFARTRSKLASFVVTSVLVSGTLLAVQPAHASTVGGEESPLIEEEYTVSIGGVVYDDSEPQMSAMLAAPGCNAGDAETKRVTNWKRRNPNGVARLICGTSGYGWRHIAARHGQDYQNIVTKYQLGRSWNDFAMWAMSTTVGAPASAPVNPYNNTWGYTAPIQIKNNKGQVVRTYSMLVSVSRSDEKIITAFPR